MATEPQPPPVGQQADQSPQAAGPGGISPAEWGLMPDRSPTENLTAAEFLRYWFVQYNPLYFFSALCVFAGVYLVAGDLDNLRFFSVEQAHFGLFAIIQLYELALIGGAAFLVHRNIGGRVAAILALLELVFIYDCSFRLESVAHYGSLGVLASFAWVVLTAVKLWALRLALALRVSISAFVAVLGGALGTAVMVQVLTTGLVDASIVYQVAGWYGAGLALAIRLLGPRVEAPLAVLAADRIKVDRALGAAPWVLGGFYFYHLWNHILWLGNGHPAAWLGQIGILMLVTALIVRRESHIWLFGVVSVGLTVGHPPLVFVGALLTAGVFALRVRQGAPERLLVSAVLLVYLASISFGWKTGYPFPAIPGLVSWQTLLLIGALLYLGWRRRLGLAWAVLAAGALFRLPEYLLPLWVWLSNSALALGTVLLGAGFLTLFGGLAVNWWLRGSSPKSVSTGGVEVRGGAPGTSEYEVKSSSPREPHSVTAPPPNAEIPNADLASAEDLRAGQNIPCPQPESVFVLEADVAAGDMGPGGRVTPTALLRPIESARMVWQDAMVWAPEPPDYRPPCEVAELALQIERAVTWPDRLRIETRVLTVSTDGVELEHRVFSQTADQSIAVARSLLVAVQAYSGERIPLPDGLRDRIRVKSATD